MRDQPITLLSNATLIDGSRNQPITSSHVLIEGDRITAVGEKDSFPFPTDIQQIDLAGKYLLPGMIDMHMHMCAPSVLVGKAPFERDEYAALQAARTLRENLQAGVTTIRDVGTQHQVSLALRRAVKEGLVPGARVFACGNAICQTGGHATDIEGLGVEADGPYAVRQAVREQWKRGADLIKVTLNGGQNVVEYTLEELEALVEEAHRLNLRVACHASILPAARQAVQVGVDTIEHGCHLDENCVREMAEKDITLVATAAVYEALFKLGQEGKTSPELTRSIEKRLTTHRQSVQMALQQDVRIVTGTDMCIPYPTLAPLPDELETLVAWGLTPMQAIQAATKNAAEALGQIDSLGTIEQGKLADLVVLDHDPLQDITAVKHVSRVMQAGKWVALI